MKFSVRDMLNLKLFESCHIVSGKKGLENEISSVDVLEVPDINKWIRKNEFLITTGFSIKDSEILQMNTIKSLSQNGAAGIGIKTGRFIDKIPSCMIEISNRLDLPIIEMPPSIAYIDILNTLLGIIWNNNSIQNKKIDLFNQKLNKFVLLSDSKELIIRTAGKEVKKSIVILNSDFQITAQYGNEVLIKNFKDNLIKNNLKEIDSIKLCEFEGLKFLICPIMIENTKYGYVTFLDIKEYEHALYNFLEITSTNLSMQLLKLKIKKETEIKTKSDIIQNVLLGKVQNNDIIQNNASYIGWRLNGKYCTAIIKIKNYSGKISDIYITLISIINNILNADNSKSIVTAKDENFILLIDNSEYKTKADQKNHTIAICSSIVKSLKNYLKNCSIYCSIGTVKDSIINLNKSYTEALEAFILTDSSKKSQVIYYDDLGIYKLLIDNISNQKFKNFYNEYLMPLVKYDADYNSELISTLNTCFENNFNLTLTSKKLFIHRNTLNYRIKKIEDLLDLDLSQCQSRLILGVSLAIHKLKKHYI